MIVQLNAIAAIFTGATLQERPQRSINFDSYLMQLSDLDVDGNLHLNNMVPFLGLKELSKFVVKPGDVIFRGRGAGINAAVMIKTSKPVIVASPLMIIRLDTQKIDPNYLTWAITNTQARHHYAQHARGSASIGIGKQDLETLEIDLPDLEIQHKISKIKRLQSQETELLTRYHSTRTKLIETLIREKAA